MTYPFSMVYNMEKFWLLAAVFGAVVLSTVLAVCFYCGNLPAERKKTLLVLQVVILLVQSGQFLALAAAPAEIELFVRVQSSGLCLLGLPFFLYCYVAAFNRYPSRRLSLALGVVPAAGVFVVWSNGLHQLFYTIYGTFYCRYGQAFALVMLYNYLLALAGLVLLARKAKGNWDFRQVWPGVGAVLLLAGLDAYELMGHLLSVYDLTPAGLAVAQILYLAGKRPFSGYHSVLRVRMNALDCIDQSVVITDAQNKILYGNKASLNTLLGVLEGREFAGIPAEVRFPREKLGLARAGEEVANGEFALFLPGLTAPRHYVYYVRTLGAEGGQAARLLYSFRDISVYKELIEELSRKHRELAVASERLQEYVFVVRKLAEEMERERIVHQVNTTVGQAVARIVANLEEIESGGEKALTDEKIRESVECARSSIKKIRSSIAALSLPGREGGADDDPCPDSR
jgi:signal transduction histidine kinase